MSRMLALEIIKSGVILVIAYIIGRVLTTAIHYLLKTIQAPKAAHLITTNVTWVLVSWIVVLAVLSTLGLKEAFNLGAIGLGVVILLVQGLVTSIVQGFIIVVEHDFDVGDYISVAGMTGTVYDIGLRLTFLLNDDGQTVAVPNSTIYNSGITRGRLPKPAPAGDTTDVGTREPPVNTIQDTRLRLGTAKARQKGLLIFRSIRSIGRFTSNH